MTQEPPKSNSVLIAITIALITVLGTIIVAVITASGNYKVEKLRQETELTRVALVSMQTQSFAPQIYTAPSTDNNSTIFPSPTVPYTQIPNPTETPYIIPSIEPSVTQIVGMQSGDTPLDSILQIGETWTSQGLSITLRSLTFSFGNEADLQFTFANNTGGTLFFHLSRDSHVLLKDNNGKIYTWATPYEDDFILENSEYIDVPVYKGGNFSGIQYLIITVDIPNLIRAQWKSN